MSLQRSSRFFILSILIILLSTNLLVASGLPQEQLAQAANTKPRHLVRKRPRKKKTTPPTRVQSNGNVSVRVGESPAENKNVSPTPNFVSSPSPSPSPNSTATPCPPPQQIKETSVQSV